MFLVPGFLYFTICLLSIHVTTYAKVGESSKTVNVIDTYSGNVSQTRLNVTNHDIPAINLVDDNEESLLLWNQSVADTDTQISSTRKPATTQFNEQQIVESVDPPLSQSVTTSSGREQVKNTAMNVTSQGVLTDNVSLPFINSTDVKHNFTTYTDVNHDSGNSTTPPRGKFDQVFTTTEYSTVVQTKHGDISDYLRRPVSFEHISYDSIATGIILAISGVTIFVAAVFLFRRQKRNLKQKLMMNFDLNRINLQDLRRQPANVLIVDFPLNHEIDTWHDVKPVTSSVV